MKKNKETAIKESFDSKTLCKWAIPLTPSFLPSERIWAIMAGSLSSSNKLIGGKKILEPFNYMIKQIVVTELKRRFLFLLTMMTEG